MFIWSFWESCWNGLWRTISSLYLTDHITVTYRPFHNRVHAKQRPKTKDLKTKTWKWKWRLISLSLTLNFCKVISATEKLGNQQRNDLQSEDHGFILLPVARHPKKTCCTTYILRNPYFRGLHRGLQLGKNRNMHEMYTVRDYFYAIIWKTKTCSKSTTKRNFVFVVTVVCFRK